MKKKNIRRLYKKDCEIRRLTIENKELKKCIAQQQSSWQKKFNKLIKDNK